MPVAREWSLDRALAAKQPPQAGDGLLPGAWCCACTSASSISRRGSRNRAGDQWWSGEALWRALSLPQYQQVDPSFLLPYPGASPGARRADHPRPARVPGARLDARARCPSWCSPSACTSASRFSSGLWLFSAMMIVLNTAAFGEALWKALATRGARPRRGTGTALALAIPNRANPSPAQGVRTHEAAVQKASPSSS
jgi:hypothetical protein